MDGWIEYVCPATPATSLEALVINTSLVSFGHLMASFSLVDPGAWSLKSLFVVGSRRALLLLVADPALPVPASMKWCRAPVVPHSACLRLHQRPFPRVPPRVSGFPKGRAALPAAL